MCPINIRPSPHRRGPAEAMHDVIAFDDMMSPEMMRDQATSIQELFTDCHPTLLERPITDFSGLESQASIFCQVAPHSTEVVRRILSRDNEHALPILTRAQGHSLTGSSLPHSGDLSFSTESLRVIRFDDPGTVTVGCGVVLWILQHVLDRLEFDLPVLNDGYPGPSVGGFMASGGFGPRSDLFGGFWNNVIDVGLIDGLGNTHRVARTDPLFPWLFGSMGQLGIFVDAKLAIVPREARTSPPYPLGTKLLAPLLVAPKVPAEFAVGGDERLFWFTLFVPDECIDDAHRELRQLERRHSKVLRFQERYRYPILFRDVVAPLVYPYARRVTATGAWGWLTDSGIDRIAKLRDFDLEFMELGASRPDYRRYVQSEMPSGPGVYEKCFGPKIYAHFLRLKTKLDPKWLLNRGSVFAVPDGARIEPPATQSGMSP